MIHDADLPNEYNPKIQKQDELGQISWVSD